MPDAEKRGGLFPALLKHWRHKRGLSQLDLALAADVSSRHVSFLETGRSAPSGEMVIRLGATLDVPLRHINAMLAAAGYEPFYDEPEGRATIPDEVRPLVQMMMDHHEPFPLIVVDRIYDVVEVNKGAMTMLAAVMPQLAEDGPVGTNLVYATFDPEGAQPFIANFDEVGRVILWRLQREVLADPNDVELRELLDSILALHTVSDSWRDADLSVPSLPALPIQIKAGPFEMAFMTMVTAF